MAEQLCDFAMTPKKCSDQRRAAVAACEEVGTRAGREEQPGEVAVVPVAGLVELRPAVVVPAVHVRAALDQERRDLQVARHADEVVPVRSTLDDEVGEPVEELDQGVAVVCLERSVRQHERRRRLVAAAHRLDVATQLLPARVPVSLCESQRASATLTPSTEAMPFARSS